MSRAQYEQWKKEQTDCALGVMDVVVEYNPQAALPALIACMKTLITMSVRDDDGIPKVIEMVKSKLDDLVSHEHSHLEMLLHQFKGERIDQ